jgi:hypothetical protein
MLMTKHFMFIHIPCTGGELVRKACFANLPAEWFIPNDLDWFTPYEQLRDDFGDLPAFTLVSNPWRWYASWYEHITRHDPESRTGEMWEIAFENGSADFHTVVTRACTGQQFTNRRTKQLMDARGLDHYSALYEIATGSPDRDRVETLRCEELGSAVPAFFARNDIPVGRDLLDALAGAAAGALDNRPNYRALYDDGLRQLVGDKTHSIVESHGYSF